MSTVYTFACPVCRKRFSADTPGEPCCTGPNESTHEHAIAVMRLIKIERHEVGPHYAARRAAGVLLIPGGSYDALIDREAKAAS